MTLILTFLFIFAVILLVGQFSRPTNIRARKRRRIQDDGRNVQIEQSSMPATPANEWWLHSNADIPPSHTDHTVSHHSAPSDDMHHSPVSGVDSSVNTGSTDFSGGSDWGGFSGGGGDAGGGGAGGNW
jgi:uncharacterized membrane protein YgcG